MILNLAVGDCVANLGTQDASEPADSEEASTVTSASSAASTAGVRKSSSAKSSASSTATSATSATRSAKSTEPIESTEPTDSGSQLDDSVPLATDDVTKIDCSEPHVGEVYAQHELDNQLLFPGSLMPEFTSAVCTGKAFSNYIGYPFPSSIFDAIAYAPSKESWSAGDRTVTCIVTDPATGYIEGTLEDAGY